MSEPLRAIVNVDVVVADGTDTVLEDQTVLFRGSIIEQVGAAGSITVSDSAEVIDGTDHWLAPGLTDFHTHITVGSAEAAEDQGLLFVANGVTTILNMGDVGINGDVRDYQRRYLTNTIPGPTMFLGKFARGPEDGGASQGLVVTSASSAAQFVTRARLDGYDFIKVYNWVRQPVWTALVREGASQGLPVIGHVPVPVPIRTALRDGQRMIAHASEYYWAHYDTLPDASQTQSAIDMTVAAGAWMTATLSASESVNAVFGNNSAGYSALIGRESYRYTHRDIRAHWRNWLNNGDVPGGRDSWTAFMKAFTNDFHNGGVRLLVGTDGPDVVGLASGFGVYEELRLLEEVGIPRADILKIATRNAGDFIAETLSGREPFGRIEVGHRADFLLLRSNPLDDLANLKDRAGVVVRGTWISQADLDAALEQLAQRYGN